MAPNRPPMPQLRTVSVPKSLEGWVFSHDPVGEALAFVEPFGHVVDRRRKQHAGTDAVEWSQADYELQRLCLRSTKRFDEDARSLR